VGIGKTEEEEKGPSLEDIYKVSWEDVEKGVSSALEKPGSKYKELKEKLSPSVREGGKIVKETMETPYKALYDVLKKLYEKKREVTIGGILGRPLYILRKRIGILKEILKSYLKRGEEK